MATLTAWKFDDPNGAARAIATLEGLAKQNLIEIQDGAIVEWQPGKKKPKTKQLNNLAGVGALSGSFWGLLFGLIFFVPILGMAIGAATGALAGGMADVGIDDDFIESIRKQVQPGTSALFVMTSNAVIDKVHDAFAGQQPELISTNLSKEQEAQLRELFTED